MTAAVTYEALAIQADHVLIALQAATARIGRTLTAATVTTPPSADLRRARARRPSPTPARWPSWRCARPTSRTAS